MTIQRNNNKNNAPLTMDFCWLGLIILTGFQTCSATPSLRSGSRNLIIGGATAPSNRFPYYVALKDTDGEIQCGGTLIAPDMVLTAAHCRYSNLMYADVGRYSKIEEEGFGEEIKIMNPLEMMTSGRWSTVRNLETANATIVDAAGFIHPLHDLKKRTYDVMVMKLARPVSPDRPIVKISSKSNVPVKQPGGKNEITIIGMGNSEVRGDLPKAPRLKQVHVDYLPYDECIDVNNYNLDYKFELLPHMICTHGAGIYGDRGQCYGDSGGPYILMGPNDSSSEDVQVGVVSWAVNCANSIFPMVGSRTSESIHFIREVVCSISADPPSYLCSEENNDIDESLSNRLIPDGVKVSVRIFSDPFGHELRWKITDLEDDSQIYGEAPYGKIVGDHSFQDVIVPAGGSLKFTIDDAADDGIWGDADAILYEIVLVDSGGELIIVEGNGQFNTTRIEPFRVPQLSDEHLALVRAAKAESSKKQYATIVGPTARLEIYIEFADYHEDAAWSVTSLNGLETYAYKNANEYRYGSDVTELVDLPAGEYQFTISDRRGTDEYRAFNFYKLSYLDKSLGGETTVFQSVGLFDGETSSHSFVIPVSATVDTADLASSPGVVIGDEAFLDEATQLCFPLNHFCSEDSHCCTSNCSNMRCGEKVEEPQIEGATQDCLPLRHYCQNYSDCCTGNCFSSKCMPSSIHDYTRA